MIAALQKMTWFPHRVLLHQQGPDSYLPVCSCGWKGQPAAGSDAEAEAEAHTARFIERRTLG